MLNEFKNWNFEHFVPLLRCFELIYATENFYSAFLQMFNFKLVLVQNKNQLCIRKVSFDNGRNCIIWFNIWYKRLQNCAENISISRVLSWDIIKVRFNICYWTCLSSMGFLAERNLISKINFSNCKNWTCGSLWLSLAVWAQSGSIGSSVLQYYTHQPTK